MSAERIPVNGVDLCLETFGDRAHPAILLIGGAAGSMDWWEDEFCERVAGGLRFVVRYDLRDTGQSTTSPAGAPDYGGPDLVRDAVGLLDALDLPHAHIVGISMGGGIAQRLALDYPDRVTSLTLLSTSPGGPGGPAHPDLPPMARRLQDVLAAPSAEPDWSDRAAVIDHIVDGERPFAGSIAADERRLRELAARVVDRSIDIAASMTNHYLIDGGDPVRPRLGAITAPTLIMHGTDDPLFPYGHAEALAREIPTSVLVPLPGVGHQMPPPEVWDIVVPAILNHTSGGWDEQGDRLAATALAVGDATGWFERLYSAAAAGEVPMPWDRREPHWVLAAWADERRLNGSGLRAVVVGCGLGADAAYLADLGFDITAFDLSETAVRTARDRFPGAVDYVQANLLDLPDKWMRAFDLVVEIFTVQALPLSLRQEATAHVARLVAPGGTLLVVEAVQDEGVPQPAGPPWPFTRTQVENFATDGVLVERIEVVTNPRQPDQRRWRAEFRRPNPHSRPSGGRASDRSRPHRTQA